MRGRSTLLILFWLPCFVFLLSASGRKLNVSPDKGDSKFEAGNDMRYMQPYANPQKNSFQPVKLTASGVMSWKITYADASVTGAAANIFLIDDSHAVIDYGRAIYAIDLDQRKKLGIQDKSANSFVALGKGDVFYYAASNQLIMGKIATFNERQPDFFIPGLGEFSSLLSLLPQAESFSAAIQNRGNPMYPDPTFSLFNKTYPSLGTIWSVGFPGTALAPAFFSDNSAILCKTDNLAIIDIKGQTISEFKDKFAPQLVSIGPDDTVYLFAQTPTGNKLIAFDMKLEKKWEAHSDKQNLSCPPIKGNAQTTYLLGNNTVTAYREGRLVWETRLMSDRARATLSGDNQLVISDGGRIICLGSDGFEKWIYEDKDGEIWSTPPVFDSQGNIFAASDKSIIKIE
jgi:hypothetical protein